MKPLSRRDFLKDTATLALLAGGACFFDPFLHTVLAATTPVGTELWLLDDSLTTEPGYGGPRQISITGPGSINGLDVRSGQSFKVDIPFFGHTVAQNPLHPHQVVTFEKWGLRGALVDLREKTVLASVTADEGNTFFGHAAFVSGGSMLATCEDNFHNTQSQLILRDPVSLKPVQRINSYGVRPHDCHPLEDGKIAMVVNAGSKMVASNLVWVELASGKLLHKVEFDYEPGLTFGHVGVASDGWICVIGLMQPVMQKGNARIVFISPGGQMMRPKIPENIAATMSGEMLSLIFWDGGLVAVTLAGSNKVVLLDYKTQELVNIIELPSPKGILRDLTAPVSEIGMIVNDTRNRKIAKIELSSPYDKPIISMQNPQFGGNGTHLVRVYV